MLAHGKHPAGMDMTPVSHRVNGHRSETERATSCRSEMGLQFACCQTRDGENRAAPKVIVLRRSQ